MPKDTWRTSSSRYRDIIRRGAQDKQLRREDHKRRRSKRSTAIYTVPAGTPVYVRKPGGSWKPHTTRVVVVCRGYLWRNETHVGLRFGEWEIKVERRRCR